MAKDTLEYAGRYRMLNQLQEGKSCQVWEVMDDLNQKRYAIKLLRGRQFNKVEESFLRHEFQVGGKLDHPNVIHIHDFGRLADSGCFLVMELTATVNLKQVYHEGFELLAPRLDQILTQCAEGLAYFHRQGWIHRDVKPDNYLCSLQHDIKLIDFALAVPIRRGLSRLWSRGPRLVQGTRSYMSPEQIRCQTLDQRSDIYSFGCMCFELAAGRLPFTGSTTNELLTKHLRSPAPPIQSLNSNLSDDFARLIQQLLAKLPAQRPASLEEVLTALQGMKIFKVPPKADVSPTD